MNISNSKKAQSYINHQSGDTNLNDSKESSYRQLIPAEEIYTNLYPNSTGNKQTVLVSTQPYNLGHDVEI